MCLSLWPYIRRIRIIIGFVPLLFHGASGWGQLGLRSLRISTVMMFLNNEHSTSQAGAGDVQLVVGSTGGPQSFAHDNENVHYSRTDGDDAKIHWGGRIQSNTSNDSPTLGATNTIIVPLNLNNITFYDQVQHFDRNNGSDDNLSLSSFDGDDQARMQRYPANLVHCYGVNGVTRDQSQGIDPTSDGNLEDMRTDYCKNVSIVSTSTPQLGEANNFIKSPRFSAPGKRVTDHSNGSTLSRPEMAHYYDESQLMMSIQNEFGDLTNANRHTNEPMFDAQLACFSQKCLRDTNDATYYVAVNTNQAHQNVYTDDSTFYQPLVSQGTTGVSFQNQTMKSPSFRDNKTIFHGTMSNRSESYVNDGLNFGQSLRIDAACTSSMITRSVPHSFTMLHSQPQISSLVRTSMYSNGGVACLTASSIPRQGEFFDTSFAITHEAERLNQSLPEKSQSQSTVKQTFVLKIMNILSVDECQSAIRWTPAGDAFCVLDAKELVEKVLPKYFKETKYTSFVSRQSILQK